MPIFGVFGDGSYRLQPIHVDDFAALAVEHAERTESVVIDAIGPETFSFRSLVETINEGSFDENLTRDVEPKLGVRVPTFLHDYPASMAALAKLKTDDPSVAERVELYVAGVELANGFSELVDVEEQRKRFEQERSSRAETGRDVYPVPEPFLNDLAHMPPSAGMALGVDRLVMLFAGAETIDEVSTFTPEEI